MNKVFLYCFVFLLAMSLVCAACTDSDGGDTPNQKGQVQPIAEGDGSNGMDYCYTGEDDAIGVESYLLEWHCGQSGATMAVHKCPKGCKEGACVSDGTSDNNSGSQDQEDNNTANQGQASQLQVQKNSEKSYTIRSKDGTTEAETSMNVSQGEDGKDYAELSNGFKSEIKVMPETASAKALQVLGAKCEERGCEIELKEVGKGEEAKLVYEVKAKKEVKALGFIKSQMKVKAQIDAETGEVVKTKNAWWGFLAKKE